VRLAFDLDGTLIDSLPQIHEALHRGLFDCNLPEVPAETVRGFVGNGLDMLLSRVLDHLGEDSARHPALTERVMHHYVTVPCDPGMLYPRVPEALTALRAAGHGLAVCTNKPFHAALSALEQTGLLPMFDLVIGGDSLPTRKPHPDMLRACAPDLFIGDSEVDAATAEAAATPFLLFTEGYRKSPVDSLTHRAAFDDFARLPTLV
jgi:phosphoglycolate phosphatase